MIPIPSCSTRILPALAVLGCSLMCASAASAEARPATAYTAHRALVLHELPPGHRYQIVRGTRYVVDRHGRWHRIAGPGWILVARPSAAARPGPPPRVLVVPDKRVPVVRPQPAPGRPVTLSPRAPIISA